MKGDTYKLILNLNHSDGAFALKVFITVMLHLIASYQYVLIRQLCPEDSTNLLPAKIPNLVNSSDQGKQSILK